MNRIIVIIVDGLGDLNFSSGDNEISDLFSDIRTPTISKYFLNSATGYFGLMDPVEPGTACGSDTAHLSIFGLDPLKFYTGRGSFETIGAGIAMFPGDIAFKCNFACIDEISENVLLRRVDKDFNCEAKELCQYLQNELNRPGLWLFHEGITVTIQHATEHRCGLKISKRDFTLSGDISGTDPLFDNRPLLECKAIKEKDSIAEQTSTIVQRISKEITRLLLKHPINILRENQGKKLANCVLFRGCSRAPEMPTFIDHHSVNWMPMMMARTCIISGIGRELGFGLCNFPKSEAEIENESTILTDIHIFIDCLHSNRDCQFSVFHIKSVDEASHEQNHSLKIRLIESIDKIIQNAIDRICREFGDDQFRIILTGDHTTSSRIGEHSCEPVPFVVSSCLRSDIPYYSLEQSLNFKNCFFNNNLGRFSGKSFIEFIKSLVKTK